MLGQRRKRWLNINSALVECIVCGGNIANTVHSPNAVSMLIHRLRRWPNIETALGECPMFTGNVNATNGL